MKIVELNHVALSVSDVERSRRFYGESLGLEAIPRPAFDFPGAWFRLGSVQELHLIGGRDESPNSSSPRGGHFALRVADIKGAADALRGKGVAFEGPFRRPDGARQIFLPDPDGNVIELCQAV